jgi:hypothetical protein
LSAYPFISAKVYARPIFACGAFCHREGQRQAGFWDLQERHFIGILEYASLGICSQEIEVM